MPPTLRGPYRDPFLDVGLPRMSSSTSSHVKSPVGDHVKSHVTLPLIIMAAKPN
jgi:hypothetical protein